MKNIYPVLFFALLVLALPHGSMETLAVIGAIVTGAWGLYRTFKKPDTWERRLQRELKKAGIKSEIITIPNGKTLADVMEELLKD